MGQIFRKILDPAGIFDSLGGPGAPAGESGGSGGSSPQAAQAAGAAVGSPAVAPGTSPDEYKKQQQAYYQQMLAGTGQSTVDGQLPAGIQDNINKQASLIS